MRPKAQMPAHHSNKFAELVCSNSLQANTISNVQGKELVVMPPETMIHSMVH